MDEQDRQDLEFGVLIHGVTGQVPSQRFIIRRKKDSRPRDFFHDAKSSLDM